MRFSDFKLNEVILKALEKQGYEEPSEIQQLAIPHILEKKDVLGCAQTGTGKTCAFMVPLIQRILNNPKSGDIKALILTPTRELAIQILDNTKDYAAFTKIKAGAIYGGVKEGSQKSMLINGVDILIATPGRLIDFIQQGVVDISRIQYFVLDEADRMLDMGFIVDVKRIMKEIPRKRQTLLFSATMPDTILKLCDELLHEPARVSVTPPSTTVELIDQKLYFVDKENKMRLLVDMLKNDGIFTALIFCRTKHGADKITHSLTASGISALAIHGNKSQNARQRALAAFKAAKIQALVTTDITARGIDIDYLSHVFNYDLPDTPETYVHRIGRTARAGRSGVSITFCSFNEIDMLKEIEKLIKVKIPVIEEHPYPMKNFSEEKKKQGPSKIVRNHERRPRPHVLSGKSPANKKNKKQTNL